MQHRAGAPDIPEFSVVFKGDALEPIADVAPEGEVVFVIVNESEAPHDFAVVDVACVEAQPRRFETGEPGCIGEVPAIEPGGSRTATFHLERGRYVLLSNTPGDSLGTSLFDLTVQPVEGTA